jgi:hypothetical protein
MAGGSEPSVLGTHITFLRDVAAEVWGKDAIAGLIARLDAASRAVLEADDLAGTWVPMRHYAAFVEPVWRELCHGRADDAFLHWIDEVTARGWGARRELFTSFANPVLLFRHGQDLWRKEYSTGKVTYAPLGPKKARLTLRDHPFTETEGMRAAIAESIRYIVVLCDAAEVKATHELGKDGALHLTITWA